MSQILGGSSDGAKVQAIMAALRSCYEDLDSPNFRRVASALASQPYQLLIDKLRTDGITVTDTTDPNDDVSVQLVASQGTDQVALELSAVGRFAALRHLETDGSSLWVARPSDAPTALAKKVAQTVKGANLHLLDRQTATREITMNRTATTLYKALFTDSDRVP